MPQKIKIALVGNLANNFYREAKSLQSSETLEAHLFFHRVEGDSTRLPESDEPNLAGNYPTWIKTYPGFLKSKLGLLLFYIGISFPLGKLNREWISRFDEYDICIFSSFDLPFIYFLKGKTVFRATGGDMTILPLFSWLQYRKLMGQSGFKIAELKQIIAWYLMRKLYNSSIRAAKYVDLGFGRPFSVAAEKLKIAPDRRIHQFRLAIDTTVFRSRSKDILLKKLGLDSGCFYVLMPSRMMIKDDEILVETGQWKASDNALNGFQLFLDAIPTASRANVKLLIPDRTNSNDLPLAKKIVEELNLCENVIYIKGQKTDGFTRDELIDYYSLSSVVLDDFGAGWYGSIVVEALSCGVPVVTHVLEEDMNKVFPWHPIQLAKRPEDIANALLKLFLDSSYYDQIKFDSQRWVLEFHSNEAISRNYENIIPRLITLDD